MATRKVGEMASGVVITHALRSPYAKYGSALRELSAVQLGRHVVDGVVRAAAIDPAAIDEVVVGCAGNPIDAANVARVIALRADLPESTPAVTVQRNCGSGLEAITTAVEKIRAGRARVVLAAGVESMSSYPLLFHRRAQRKFEALAGARSALSRLRAMARFRRRDFAPAVALEAGLTDPVCGLNMGETAEVLARDFDIGRAEQDEYALRSHQRWCAAQDAGRFVDERLPIAVDGVEIDTDVGPRSGQSMDALARLRPVFDRRSGTVTAGNSCMVSDGAAAVLVMSEAASRELGCDPLGRVAGYGWAGCAPRRMGLGPCYATPLALDDAGVSLQQIGRVELNEAFAAQVLACARCFASPEFARDELGRGAALGDIDPRALNVNGGAIAMGHPVGSSGTRLVVTLLHEMKRRAIAHGLATLCIGGGQGGAMVLAR